MYKSLVVARIEYLTAVTSKAFLMGLFLMPVFVAGGIVVQHLTRDQVDVTDRRVAIVDHSGKLWQAITQRAQLRNQNEVFDSSAGSQVQPRFLIETYQASQSDSARPDLVLSSRVRSGEIFAFVIIPQNVFAVPNPSVAYYSDAPSYTTLPDWLEQTINGEIQRVRLASVGLSPEDLAKMTEQVELQKLGLVEVNAEGEIIEPKEESRLITFGVPMIGMMLLFMMVMTVAPATLNNVLEEKMQKISEFLISSVSPFQLMLGKLLGTILVALTLSLLYLGTVYGVAEYFEVTDRIRPSLYGWFLLFLLLALVIYGSIFSAIGAACSEIRDAQSLMTPIMLIVIIPMLCVGPVLQSPGSPFARLVSLFPPATPMLMFLRIAIPPGPPLWEVILGVVLTFAFALMCVWAGGKIFRIGILSQGQAPSLANLVQWMLSR